MRSIAYAYMCFILDDNETTTYLAFGCQSSEFQSTCNPLNNARLQSPVEFLINLYREHGTKKPFCDSIFDLKEQLIALQLVMAQLNKEVRKLFHTLSSFKKCQCMVSSLLSERQSDSILAGGNSQIKNDRDACW